MVAFSMALSTLFTDSKLSTQIGIFILFIPSSVVFYALVAAASDSIVAATIDIQPYYGEQWLILGYILPHFSYAWILLDFLVDDGI